VGRGEGGEGERHREEGKKGGGGREGRKGEGGREGWVGAPPCEILNTPLGVTGHDSCSLKKCH